MTALPARVLVAPLVRERGLAVAFTDAIPAPHPVVRRPAKVARILALAHHIQRAIDSGAVADRAAVARKLGLTRARVTQLLDLLLLAPEIQDSVLHAEAVDGAEPFTERTLRPIALAVSWTEQRETWKGIG